MMCLTYDFRPRSSCIIVLVLGLSYSVIGQHVTEKNENSKASGFVDFNAYRDTRAFSELTINALANVTDRIQYFSLTNNSGAPNTSDVQSFFSEQNIRWKVAKNSPVDFTSQWTLRTGEDNDNWRLGFRVRLNNLTPLESLFSKINLTYSLNFHLLQFDFDKPVKYFTQMEHVYRLLLFPELLNRRVYISGFADQNFRSGGEENKTKWVTEHQLGIRIINEFYIVAEYRVNDFFSSDHYGLGYGLEYKIIF
ncbi:MAG: hypothetical protein ABJF11_18775 [Reichenbachiella sp.]|uniref:hypothetical protein n=1 Tax=Reichenbachiella sp. TaxID=2184521 RepID=UPI003266325C